MISGPLSRMVAMRPLNRTTMRSLRRSNSSRSALTSSVGATALRHFVDAAVQEGSCRNINAARRLVGDQEFRIGGKFTRGNQLLRIAAGRESSLSVMAPARTEYCLIMPLTRALDGAPAQKRPPENLPVGGD